MMTKISTIAAFVLLSACAGDVGHPTARAQGPGGQGEAGRNGPPPEAYRACSSAQMGTRCTMQTPHGRLSGQCETPSGVSGLVCVPDGHNTNTRPDQSQNRGRTGGQQAGGQIGGNDRPPPPRTHSVTQSSGQVDLHPATVNPIARAEASFGVNGDVRIIQANSIARHKTGIFPNPGNPNTISEQSTYVRVPANPDSSNLGQPTTVRVFGYALNGVKFEPGAGEVYADEGETGGNSGFGQGREQTRRGPPPPRGQSANSGASGPPSGAGPSSGGPRWQYEALSGAVPLGLDENHAHVQPTGHYHYHALPTLFLKELNAVDGQHSPLVGYAMDGFPIYARYGYANISGQAQLMRSGWQMKSGARPTGNGNPGGYYDGTFTADYEFVGKGNLDECNGARVATPEYPGGTYAYFLTDEWPYVPRCIRGTSLEVELGPR